MGRRGVIIQPTTHIKFSFYLELCPGCRQTPKPHLLRANPVRCGSSPLLPGAVSQFHGYWSRGARPVVSGLWPSLTSSGFTEMSASAHFPSLWLPPFTWLEACPDPPASESHPCHSSHSVCFPAPYCEAKCGAWLPLPVTSCSPRRGLGAYSLQVHVTTEDQCLPRLHTSDTSLGTPVYSVHGIPHP